ncbi:MAG: cell wall hydrolase [Croceibacterium sp.]
MIVTIFGAGPSGARAEIPAAQPIVMAATSAAPLAADEPRFVAEAIVQPLPTSYGTADQAGSLAQMVNAMPDTELTGDMLCLAQAIYFESRGEPLDGQLAVGQVVVNRAHSSQYPSDYCSVVTQPSQFSFVHHGAIPHPNLQSAAWVRAKAVAQIAHQDLWDSAAKDALYFHATYVRPSWARRKVELAQIDTHIFYR